MSYRTLNGLQGDYQCFVDRYQIIEKLNTIKLRGNNLKETPKLISPLCTKLQKVDASQNMYVH